MAEPFTDNNSTTYININQCKSFTLTLATSARSFANQPCSEVIVVNATGATLSATDNGLSGAANTLLIPNNTVVTLRGLTNSNQVSAAGSGVLSYRAQFFSSNPLR